MTQQKIAQEKLARFSRTIALLFNRATMYQINHPYVKQTIDDFYSAVVQLLRSVSPLAFILNREQLFIEEEPFDSHINVNRIVAHFKKAGIQSISFEHGLGKDELRAFLEIFTSLDKYPDAEAMKKVMESKGLNHVKINHFFYKKVTADDEVVSQEALKKLTLAATPEDQSKSKKIFFDMILESALAEELGQVVSVENLVVDPDAVSEGMIKIDLTASREHEAEGVGLGETLVHQIEMIRQEVNKKLAEGRDIDLQAMTTAVFDLKKRLLENMEVQRKSELNYSSEEMIRSKLNEVTDHMLLELIKEQYTTNGMSAAQLTQTVRSFVPDPQDIQRILPKIRTVLFEKSFNVTNLVKNPAAISKKMIEADLTDSRREITGSHGPGTLLMHQLDVLDQEIKKDIQSDRKIDLSEVAVAVFEMKKRLIEGLEARKALEIVYSKEEEILGKATEITDNVLIQLIKSEYKAGAISTSRLAQILRRLVPEADELKRLLPKIKKALLEEGMPLTKYLNLVRELGKELQNEELTKILQESSEEIGIDGETLIQEIKKNPTQAAELIFLAAEIRKSTGDEKVMTDLLVDYVERLGSQLAQDEGKEGGVQNDQHVRQMIAGIESGILGRLKNMNVQEDLLKRLEERFNSRMDEILLKVKTDWIRSASDKGNNREALSLLQILEQSVSETEELGEILKIVRSKAQSGEIDEDDFGKIFTEITYQQRRKREEEEIQRMPAGVLSTSALMILLDKEISRAKRYNIPFAALSFSLVQVERSTDDLKKDLPEYVLGDLILKRISEIVRESDIVGELDKNKIAVLLPMTSQDGARIALRRCLRLLHTKPLFVGDVPVTIKVTGVTNALDPLKTQNAEKFIEILLRDLSLMETRLRNIQTYF